MEEPLGAKLSSYLPRIDGFAVLIKAIAVQSRQGGHPRGRIDTVESVMCSSFEPTLCRVGVRRRCGWPGLFSTPKFETQWWIDPVLFHLRLDSHHDDLRSYILCV